MGRLRGRSRRGRHRRVNHRVHRLGETLVPCCDYTPGAGRGPGHIHIVVRVARDRRWRDANGGDARRTHPSLLRPRNCGAGMARIPDTHGTTRMDLPMYPHVTPSQHRRSGP